MGVPLECWTKEGSRNEKVRENWKDAGVAGRIRGGERNKGEMHSPFVNKHKLRKGTRSLCRSG